MRIAIVALLILLVACTPSTIREKSTSNSTGDTGSGIDFCNQDAECVRQPSCCDCGAGTWVNRQYQLESPAQCDHMCKCALQRAVGVCRNNRCVGELA